MQLMMTMVITPLFVIIYADTSESEIQGSEEEQAGEEESSAEDSQKDGFVSPLPAPSSLRTNRVVPSPLKGENAKPHTGTLSSLTGYFGGKGSNDDIEDTLIKEAHQDLQHLLSIYHHHSVLETSVLGGHGVRGHLKQTRKYNKRFRPTSGGNDSDDSVVEEMGLYEEVEWRFGRMVGILWGSTRLGGYSEFSQPNNVGNSHANFSLPPLVLQYYHHQIAALCYHGARVRSYMNAGYISGRPYQLYRLKLYRERQREELLRRRRVAASGNVSNRNGKTITDSTDGNANKSIGGKQSLFDGSEKALVTNPYLPLLYRTQYSFSLLSLWYMDSLPDYHVAILTGRSRGAMGAEEGVAGYGPLGVVYPLTFTLPRLYSTAVHPHPTEGSRDDVGGTGQDAKDSRERDASAIAVHGKVKEDDEESKDGTDDGNSHGHNNAGVREASSAVKLSAGYHHHHHHPKVKPILSFTLGLRITFWMQRICLVLLLLLLIGSVYYTVRVWSYNGYLLYCPASGYMAMTVMMLYIIIDCGYISTIIAAYHHLYVPITILSQRLTVLGLDGEGSRRDGLVVETSKVDALDKDVEAGAGGSTSSSDKNDGDANAADSDGDSDDDADEEIFPAASTAMSTVRHALRVFQDNALSLLSPTGTSTLLPAHGKAGNGTNYSPSSNTRTSISTLFGVAPRVAALFPHLFESAVVLHASHHSTDDHVREANRANSGNNRRFSTQLQVGRRGSASGNMNPAVVRRQSAHALSYQRYITPTAPPQAEVERIAATSLPTPLRGIGNCDLFVCEYINSSPFYYAYLNRNKKMPIEEEKKSNDGVLYTLLHVYSQVSTGLGVLMYILWNLITTLWTIVTYPRPGFLSAIYYYLAVLVLLRALDSSLPGLHAIWLILLFVFMVGLVPVLGAYLCMTVYIEKEKKVERAKERSNRLLQILLKYEQTYEKDTSFSVSSLPTRHNTGSDGKIFGDLSSNGSNNGTINKRVFYTLSTKCNKEIDSVYRKDAQLLLPQFHWDRRRRQYPEYTIPRQWRKDVQKSEKRALKRLYRRALKTQKKGDGFLVRRRVKNLEKALAALKAAKERKDDGVEDQWSHHVDKRYAVVGMSRVKDSDDSDDDEEEEEESSEESESEDEEDSDAADDDDDDDDEDEDEDGNKGADDDANAEEKKRLAAERKAARRDRAKAKKDARKAEKAAKAKAKADVREKRKQAAMQRLKDKENLEGLERLLAVSSDSSDADDDDSDSREEKEEEEEEEEEEGEEVDSGADIDSDSPKTVSAKKEAEKQKEQQTFTDGSKIKKRHRKVHRFAATLETVTDSTSTDKKAKRRIIRHDSPGQKGSVKSNDLSKDSDLYFVKHDDEIWDSLHSLEGAFPGEGTAADAHTKQDKDGSPSTSAETPNGNRLGKSSSIASAKSKFMAALHDHCDHRSIDPTIQPVPYYKAKRVFGHFSGKSESSKSTSSDVNNEVNGRESVRKSAKSKAAFSGSPSYPDPQEWESAYENESSDEEDDLHILELRDMIHRNQEEEEEEEEE